VISIAMRGVCYEESEKRRWRRFGGEFAMRAGSGVSTCGWDWEVFPKDEYSHFGIAAGRV